MSAQPFDVLYNDITPHAKRVGKPAMDTAIRRYAREICLRTTTRRKSIPIDLVATYYWYPLTSDNSDEEVILILTAQYNDPLSGRQIPLSPTTPEDMGTTNSGGALLSKFYLEDSQIVIGPSGAVTQNVPGGLYVRTYRQPTSTAYTLDSDYLIYNWKTTVDGVLSFLLTQKDEAYYNPVLARDFKKDYEVGIAKEKTRAELASMQTSVYTATVRW